MYKEKENFDVGGLIILAMMAIPELVFIILGWNSHQSYNPYPFWALTLYLILLFFMIASSFYVSTEKAMKISWKNPFVYAVLALIAVQILFQFLVFRSMSERNLVLDKAMRILFICPFIIYSVSRRNLLMLLLGGGMLSLASFF